MGKAIFRVQTAGATRDARKLRGAARQMRTLMIEEFRTRADPELTEVFQRWAPYDQDERDDYHLQDHIEARVGTSGRVSVTVTAEARSPGSGFDYLDVTRFGRGPIFPRRAKMLSWVAGGIRYYARAVGPWSPGGDWVEEASQEAEMIADDIAEETGRVIYTRLL